MKSFKVLVAFLSVLVSVLALIMTLFAMGSDTTICNAEAPNGDWKTFTALAGTRNFDSLSTRFLSGCPVGLPPLSKMGRRVVDVILMQILVAAVCEEKGMDFSSNAYMLFDLMIIDH